MTFNTGNNVPSTDPRDLYDNAENLDRLVNGADPFYADRLGKLRESWSGMENSFNNAQEGRETAFTLSQADKESRFQAFLVSSGYVSKGDYAAGVVLSERNEYVAVDAATTGTSPGLYRPNASATLPLTLTGDWATESDNFVLLGDDVLRQDLAGSILDGKGALLVKGAVPHVAVLSDLNALPLVASQTCNVSGHNVPGVGGGIFTYYPEMPWSEHDGGVVIASGALSTWSGSEADLSALLSFSGTGTGCWARQVGDQSEYVVTWFGTTGTAQDTDLLAFNAAKSSKLRRSGGGVVRVPVGDYQFIDEFVCADFVQFVGEHRRLCRIVGKAGLGAGKAVVRACKLPVGSAEIPEYMSYTGFANCTINGSATWDIGLYVRHCTNESVFDDVTVQNCKTANSNFIGIFYVSVKNHVSRDARDRGVVIGQKLYSEGGYSEVNFTAFNNLRGNYAGLDNAYHPTNSPYKGACVTIWSANACAFDIVAGENAYGVGVVIRRGVNSVIPNIYVEANGKGTNAATAVGVRVINADFAVLKIGVLEATRHQKIHLESGVVVDVDEIYSETFSEGLFEGTGGVVLGNGHNVNLLTAADRERVINITRRIFAQFNNVPFSNYSSLDNSTTYFPESTSDVRVAIVPKVSVTTTDPILLGLSNNAAGGQELNFGTGFVAGTPVVRKFNSVVSGFCRLTQRSSSLPSSSTGIAFDIVVLQPRCQHRVVFGTDL